MIRASSNQKQTHDSRSASLPPLAIPKRSTETIMPQPTSPKALDVTGRYKLDLIKPRISSAPPPPHQPKEQIPTDLQSSRSDSLANKIDLRMIGDRTSFIEQWRQEISLPCPSPRNKKLAATIRAKNLVEMRDEESDTNPHPLFHMPAFSTQQQPKFIPHPPPPRSKPAPPGSFLASLATMDTTGGAPRRDQKSALKSSRPGPRPKRHVSFSLPEGTMSTHLEGTMVSTASSEPPCEAEFLTDIDLSPWLPSHIGVPPPGPPPPSLPSRGGRPALFLRSSVPSEEPQRKTFDIYTTPEFETLQIKDPKMANRQPVMCRSTDPREIARLAVLHHGESAVVLPGPPEETALVKKKAVSLLRRTVEKQYVARLFRDVYLAEEFQALCRAGKRSYSEQCMRFSFFPSAEDLARNRMAHPKPIILPGTPADFERLQTDMRAVAVRLLDDSR